MTGSELHFAVSKPVHCPACGDTRVVDIIYGMPGPELFMASERGEVALGGCCVDGADPSWRCLGCGTDFYRERLRALIGDDSGAE